MLFDAAHLIRHHRALQEERDERLFDIVDDAAYAKIVAERRGKGDFVADDDGLGYADDGEEHLDDDDDDGDGDDASDDRDGNAQGQFASSAAHGKTSTADVRSMLLQQGAAPVPRSSHVGSTLLGRDAGHNLAAERPVKKSRTAAGELLRAFDISACMRAPCVRIV